MSNIDISNNVELQQQIQILTAQFVQRRLIDFNELACNLCYKKCVTNPSASISTADNKCITLCHSKFIGTRRIVTKQIVDTMNVNHKSAF